jgi:hypothetical protein
MNVNVFEYLKKQQIKMHVMNMIRPRSVQNKSNNKLSTSPPSQPHVSRPFTLSKNPRAPRRTVLVEAQLQEQQSDNIDNGQPSSSSADKSKGRPTYRPSSYTELLTDAVASIVVAVKDGHKRMEVEFPAFSDVDGYKGSSDLYIDANTQFAIAAARQINATTNKRVHVLVPDQAEYNRSQEIFKATLEMSDKAVTLGHLLENRPTLLSGLASFFGGYSPSNPAAAASKADIFIVINASTVELDDLEAYCEQTVGKDKVIISWCIGLDTLRADLGLLGFPPKELQHRFLSQFLPVFYIRQRDYSKSVAVAPFIINYSGALFREYPGPWQVMLRQDNGVYACVAEDSKRRYGLGEFKEELMKAMGLNTEEEGSAMAFLRRGYKTSTWWEDDEDKETSTAWRS